MIELYLLEQLAAFARHGTLSAASKELHLTQPSLSRSMRKLEDLLGVTLFERRKNKITLNDTGRLAAEYAERILQQEADMVERLRAFDRSRHTIALGSIAPGPTMELIPLLSDLYADQTISSEIKGEQELLDGLEAGTYQLIILTRQVEDSRFHCIPCGSESLYVTVLPTHPAAARSSGVTFRELNGESFLMVSQVGVWNQIVRTKMPDSHFLLQDSAEALDEVINASTLPSFSTDLTIRLYGNRPNRVSVPILDADASMQFYCLCRRGDHVRYRILFHAIRERTMIEKKVEKPG